MTYEEFKQRVIDNLVKTRWDNKNAVKFYVNREEEWVKEAYEDAIKGLNEGDKGAFGRALNGITASMFLDYDVFI